MNEKEYMMPTIIIIICLWCILLNFNMIIFNGIVTIFCTICIIGRYQELTTQRQMILFKQKFNQTYRELYCNNFIIDRIIIHNQPIYCLGRIIDPYLLVDNFFETKRMLNEQCHKNGQYPKSYPLMKLIHDFEKYGEFQFASKKGPFHCIYIQYFYDLENKIEQQLKLHFENKTKIQCLFYYVDNASNTNKISQRFASLNVFIDQYNRYILYDIIDSDLKQII